MNKIRVVNDLKPQFTSCIILTEDKRLLMQQRPANWRTYPGYICCFGGHIDKDETPEECIIRELHEEVGGLVLTEDLVFLSSYTEEISNFTENVCGYFWHDTQGSITGCYEGDALYIKSPAELNDYPLVMDDVRWLIHCSIQKGFLPNCK